MSTIDKKFILINKLKSNFNGNNDIIEKYMLLEEIENFNEDFQFIINFFRFQFNILSIIYSKK